MFTNLKFGESVVLLSCTTKKILCFNLLLSSILCLNVGTGFDNCPGSIVKNTQTHNKNYYE